VHYHNLGPKLGASLLTRHIGWKNRKKKKKKNLYSWKLNEHGVSTFTMMLGSFNLFFQQLKQPLPVGV
jgi:hypothetical protein